MGSTPDVPLDIAERDMPVLPIRQAVLFPSAVLPLTVGRAAGLALLDEVMAHDRLVAVFTQTESGVEEPEQDDLEPIGTLARVVRMVRVGEPKMAHAIVQGIARVRLVRLTAKEPFLRGRIEPIEELPASDVETEALGKLIEEQVERIVAAGGLPPEVLTAVQALEGPAQAADFLGATLDLTIAQRSELLAERDVKARLRRMPPLLQHALEVAEVGKQIAEDMRASMSARQKEVLLREQLEAIQKQLGEGDDSSRELQELRARIEASKMPDAVRKEAERELARIGRIPAHSPEHTVARTYLELLAEMPWGTTTDDDLDLKHVRQVLDEDHYGLAPIKDRILEYLAVRRFRADARTPILCFAGPPGTGKTSLGKSIARALGRKFVRHSLGGVRDEAEIRGHRRTYIGALPGAIVQGLRRAESMNPLFMLDEIDKLGMDFRGDPSSALLEVLDPEQNSAFVDHYLDVPIDLSQVLFVCTANFLDPVPPALRDRMEVIQLSGYTDHEKLAIARRHLLPKAIRENGLESLDLELTDDAILRIARDYTSEAGLRNLERQIASALRKTARAVAEGEDPPRRIDAARVRQLLGPQRVPPERAQVLDEPGAALGLAWTPAGGEVLVVEATAMRGRKEVLLTGKLGEVMRESALAAMSWVRSHARALGVDPEELDRQDVHVHVPAGGIPKDGPSAGITICAALVSLLTRRRARTGVAMTGEVTLRGHVLPVGGIKEKVLAAHRAGLHTVILPADNERDLEEVPEEVRDALEIVFATHMRDVLEQALEDEPIGSEEHVRHEDDLRPEDRAG